MTCLLLGSLPDGYSGSLVPCEHGGRVPRICSVFKVTNATRPFDLRKDEEKIEIEVWHTSSFPLGSTALRKRSPPLVVLAICSSRETLKPRACDTKPSDARKLGNYGEGGWDE